MSEQTPKKRRQPPVALYVISTAVEWFVLAEILYYYLHNGDKTLHEAIGEWWYETRARLRNMASIRQTRDMIRDLPETET